MKPKTFQLLLVLLFGLLIITALGSLASRMASISVKPAVSETSSVYRTSSPSLQPSYIRKQAAGLSSTAGIAMPAPTRQVSIAFATATYQATSTSSPTPPAPGFTPSAAVLTASRTVLTPSAPGLTPSPTQPVVFRKVPYLVATGSDTQMMLVWQLNSTLPGRLEWGTGGAYQLGKISTSEIDDNDHLHLSTISSLEPGTKYTYRVTAGEQVFTGTFFTAAGPATDSLDFFVYGDTRDGMETHNEIAGQIIQAYTDVPSFQTFVLLVGDLVKYGDKESLWNKQLFDPQLANIRTLMANLPYVSVMGNHEQSGELFEKYFPMPFIAGRYWSFDYGPAHFSLLDQYVPYSAGSEQYEWLEKDLAASQKIWKFIVLHEPGWSAGGDHPNDKAVQQDLQPLAEKYGVSAFFAGHNHYYARAVINDIQHLTVGGGGAPFDTPDPKKDNIVVARREYSFVEISIRGNTLAGSVLSSSGEVIDTFEVVR
jgi:hypothetical protein